MACSIYVIKNNKLGIILSLLFWFEKSVTKILPFNLTCKIQQLQTDDDQGFSHFPKQPACLYLWKLLWKVLPGPSLKCSVLMRPSAGGILKKTRAFHSFPIIVHSGAYFPWKFIILFWGVLQSEKLGQKSRSYDYWPKSPKKVWEEQSRFLGTRLLSSVWIIQENYSKTRSWNGTVKSALLRNMLLVAIENHFTLRGEGPWLFSDILPSSFHDSNSGQQVRSTCGAC